MHPAHAGRQPDPMAPGPHHLIFRDTGAAAPCAGYQVFEPHFHYLFNSYYEALGPRHPRVQRGLLTRPSLAAVHAHRGMSTRVVFDA